MSTLTAWGKKLGWRAPESLVKRTKGMTTLQWTRAVAKRLLGVVPSKQHLAAVLRGAGLTAGSPAPTDAWRCGKVVTLLLDSPYFQLR